MNNIIVAIDSNCLQFLHNPNGLCITYIPYSYKIKWIYNYISIKSKPETVCCYGKFI